MNVAAASGMLEDIVQQAGKAAAHLIDPVPTRKLSAIGVGQILNLEWVFEDSGTVNWRSRIEAFLDQIEERGSGLLITVDEVRATVDVDDSDGSRLVDIAARMDAINGYASTYKRRLLKKGVVGERPGGRLDFDIPLLREYLDEFYTE